jgi:triphosphoribosyl-dephospho-CoA synthase
MAIKRPLPRTNAMKRTQTRFSIGQAATLATLIEASVPKPGNVHRGADFEDLSFYDFLTSAVAIGPTMERAADGASLGTTVLAAVEATRRVSASNVNLGTILLIAPLAKVPRDQSLRSGIAGILSGLDADDARQVYEAIRLARPGGMGRVDEADIYGPAPDDLLAAMRLAAARDLVARQFTNNFAEVLDFVAPALERLLKSGWTLPDTVVRVFLQTLAAFPDSLIARKCGPELAAQAAARAAAILQAGRAGDEPYQQALADFDFWLRADGHRRNPGTTADLIAAGLFALLREGIIELPFRFYPST